MGLWLCKSIAKNRDKQTLAEVWLNDRCPKFPSTNTWNIKYNNHKIHAHSLKSTGFLMINTEQPFRTRFWVLALKNQRSTNWQCDQWGIDPYLIQDGNWLIPAARATTILFNYRQGQNYCRIVVRETDEIDPEGWHSSNEIRNLVHLALHNCQLYNNLVVNSSTIFSSPNELKTCSLIETFNLK